MKKYQLVIGAIFRNEAPYLKEWIEFHLLMGVQRFYLTNHLSKDNYQDVLQPYIDKGIVELDHFNVEFRKKSGLNTIACIQKQVYNNILEKVRQETRWITFIDIDEFLFPTKKQNLIAFLEDYKDCAALAVHWQMYGTSGIFRFKKQELITEKLLYKAEPNYSKNLQVKTIAQTECIDSWDYPHFPTTKNNSQIVNENKDPYIYRKTTRSTVESIRVNHYWSRDKLFFYKEKIFRRFREKGSLFQSYRFFKRRQKMEKNTVYDDEILRFLPDLREKMFSDD